ncbi:hypothetical protein EC9_15040 [Rosistilla ulvae]|uniref:(5-formylfuran-3-yl)methyl phosphate synthase n=1 Tax=Rosistilla ulvae TaxID=1930277 RepID=A0A517LXH7_9BACT|nr:(5-formylfuran-3-yl)methyl phosphate synthase [Rosistilla ulvae]QDS87326.1 hypothetical protein EC9_15040 [Rosistilla ulvae]
MLKNINETTGLRSQNAARDDDSQNEMAPLLISVRSLAEAVVASRFPLAIIDFKNPAAGALGRCSDTILEGAARLRSNGLGFSAACGELCDLQSDAFSLPGDFRFAKAGPSGIADAMQMRDAMQHFRSVLPETTTPVAVAYADHVEADCLPVESIVQLAIETKYRWLLIDTATKDGRRLQDWISIRRLTDLIGNCRANGIRTVFAGSLALQDLASLRSLGPDLLGIRGAVCTAGRSTAIDPAKIRDWCQALSTPHPASNQ